MYKINETHRRNIPLAGLRVLALALVAVSWTQAAIAADYPARPVNIIVPYAAGGVVDVITRSVTDKVSANWKQPIVILDRPGGNAYIGAAAMLNAPSDGYTLMAAAPYVIVAPIIDPIAKFKYTDFVPAALIGGPPNIFVVPESVPVKTLKEFVDYAKARPGQLNTSMLGLGTSHHLGTEAFLQATGLDIVSVPYKGSPQMIPDLVSGRLSFVLAPLSAALPAIQSGRLKPLAINAKVRIPSLPDVPTLKEAGFSDDVVVMPWYGLVAPVGTPTEIVERINVEVNKALADPAVRARLEGFGTVITPASRSEFEKLMADENVRWTKLVKQRGIVAN